MGGVTTSSGGGFGGAGVYGSTMAAPVTVAAPAITTSLGGGFGGAGVYGSTMAAPMMTEVVAAPAITTMAAPVTMAAPMMTEVFASPLATTYGALPMTSGSTGTCRHCGNHFMDDSNFCRKCGKPRY